MKTPFLPKSQQNYFKDFCPITWPQVIYKPHCHYQNFSPLANGVYLKAIINKTLLRNGNCPITNLITKMGVANTVGSEGLVGVQRSKKFKKLKNSITKDVFVTIRSKN